MEVEIIRPGPGDWEKVRALRLRSLDTDPDAFGQTSGEGAAMREEEWRKRLDAGQYLCAKQGEEFVGMVCAVPEKNDKTKHIAHIYSVYVSPEVRGQGIGRKLMEKLISDVKERMPEVIKLKLNVSITQPNALALYKSVGFKEVALLEKELYVSGKYLDEHQMEMFIQTI